MQVKVHWIIDGVAEMEAESFEAAEKHIEETIRGLISDKPELLDKLGARAIQGKAYLPGSEDDVGSNPGHRRTSRRAASRSSARTLRVQAGLGHTAPGRACGLQP